MRCFKDSVAIVTGGTSGLGRALCIELGVLGATVIVAGRNNEAAQACVAEISARGGRAEAVLVDVTKAGEVQALVDGVVRRYGRIDYLFNNAGVCAVGEVRDMSIEMWQSLVDVNLWGVVHGTRAAYTVMVRQGYGHIINIAAMGGLVPEAMSVAYVTTKSAVIGLSTSLRAEGADLGIRVTVVCPGFVRTPMLDRVPVVNADRKKVFGRIPERMRVDVHQAATTILQGVADNRAIVVFPFYAKAIWWMSRVHPSLLAPGLARMVRVFRTLRQTEGEGEDSNSSALR